LKTAEGAGGYPVTDNSIDRISKNKSMIVDANVSSQSESDSDNEDYGHFVIRAKQKKFDERCKIVKFVKRM
jgi:hypothetical protein